MNRTSQLLAAIGAAIIMSFAAATAQALPMTQIPERAIRGELTDLLQNAHYRGFRHCHGRQRICARERIRRCHWRYGRRICTVRRVYECRWRPRRCHR
jgi:hypothetical protein